MRRGPIAQADLQPEKNDRGQVVITYGTFATYASAYAPKEGSDTPTQALWSGAIEGPGDQTLRITNYQGTTGAGPDSFIGIDKVVARGCA